MKNTYETPEIEIIKFAHSDIITTSGDGGVGGDVDGGELFG